MSEAEHPEIDRAERIAKGRNKREFLMDVWDRTADVIEERDVEQRTGNGQRERGYFAQLCRETSSLLEQRAGVNARKIAEVIADEYGLPADEVEATVESILADDEADEESPEVGDNSLQKPLDDINDRAEAEAPDIEQRAETLADSLEIPEWRRRRREREQEIRDRYDSRLTQEQVNRIRAREHRREAAQSDEDELDAVEHRAGRETDGKPLSESLDGMASPDVDEPDRDDDDRLSDSMESLR